MSSEILFQEDSFSFFKRKYFSIVIGVLITELFIIFTTFLLIDIIFTMSTFILFGLIICLLMSIISLLTLIMTINKRKNISKWEIVKKDNIISISINSNEYLINEISKIIFHNYDKRIEFFLKGKKKETFHNQSKTVFKSLFGVLVKFVKSEIVKV